MNYQSVLLVGSDARQMRIFESIFDLVGCEYIVVSGGQAALKILAGSKESVDLIVLASELRDMSTRECIRRLRAANYTTKIICEDENECREYAGPMPVGIVCKSFEQVLSALIFHGPGAPDNGNLVSMPLRRMGQPSSSIPSFQDARVLEIERAI